MGNSELNDEKASFTVLKKTYGVFRKDNMLHEKDRRRRVVWLGLVNEFGVNEQGREQKLRQLRVMQGDMTIT